MTNCVWRPQNVITGKMSLISSHDLIQLVITLLDKDGLQSKRFNIVVRGIWLEKRAQLEFLSGPFVRCFDSLIASHVCHLSEGTGANYHTERPRNKRIFLSIFGL